MRTLWNVLSFLAVVHVLALLLVAAWLWQSGRLNGERLAALRETLSRTVAEEAAEQAQRDKEAQEALTDQQRLAEQADPAVPSSEQVQLISMIQQRESQAVRRLADEQRMLLSQLDTATSSLDEQRAELESERMGWEAAVRDEQQRRTDEQFQQAVKQYESVPPKQGKLMLLELVNRDLRSQAVAYLDAMSPRAATKILKEFKSEEEVRLAMELLEELRTFGLKAEPGANTSNVTSAAGQSAKPAGI